MLIISSSFKRFRRRRSADATAGSPAKLCVDLAEGRGCSHESLPVLARMSDVRNASKHHHLRRGPVLVFLRDAHYHETSPWRQMGNVVPPLIRLAPVRCSSRRSPRNKSRPSGLPVWWTFG